MDGMTDDRGQDDFRRTEVDEQMTVDDIDKILMTEWLEHHLFIIFKT
jgi:hypothetical protein